MASYTNLFSVITVKGRSIPHDAQDMLRELKMAAFSIKYMMDLQLEQIRQNSKFLREAENG
jgi:hypothetical protein